MALLTGDVQRNWTGPVGSLPIMGSNLFPTPRLMGDSTHAASLCFFSDSSVRSRAFTLSLRYTRSEWNITTPFLRREYSLAKSRWLSSPSRAFACLSRGSILSFVQSVRVQDGELFLQPSEVLSELRNARLVDPVYQPLLALSDALSGPLWVSQVRPRRGLANRVHAAMSRAIGPLGALRTSGHGLLAKGS